MHHSLNKTILSVALLLMACATPAETETPVPGKQRVTVSGISAGAQMAHQLHIAYSDLFAGAGIIAGGPYGCAEGSVTTALTRCMGKTGALPVADLAATMRTAAGEGRIADTANLEDDPVWIFHGSNDSTVVAEVTDAARALYAEFIPENQITSVTDIATGHVFPASGSGNACDSFEAPWVNDCDYDAAGEILTTLHPGLEAPKAAATTGLQDIQLEGAAAAGMRETAYLFLPPNCADGDKDCVVHLVLHGCGQSAATVGTNFIEQSGYLPWGEANDIVLVFPQVEPGVMNPYACWDWWGYTGPEYATRDGKQMVLLVDWVKSLLE